MATTVLIWATLIVAIFRVCQLFFSKISNYLKDAALRSQHGCELPPELPKRWPLGIDRIKDLWETNAEGRLLAYLCKVAEDYEPGNNLTQYLLFGPRAFHLLHPSNVEAVLSTNFKGDFLSWRGIFAPLLGNGIFTQEGSAWKHSRELLRKQFVRVQYQNLDHFREHVDNLINRLPSSGIVDLQPLFFDMTLDTATALLFGRSVYSLRAGIDQHKENKLFAESFNVAQEGLAKRFRIAPWHFLYNPPAFRKACANVHRFVEGYIKELDLENAERHDMKQYGFIKQIAEESASLKELRDQLLNVLLAGRDTTACCLSWTFRLLVRHEYAMKRLREEIASVMEGNLTPNRDQIKKMPYLACVIKESESGYSRHSCRTSHSSSHVRPSSLSSCSVEQSRSGANYYSTNRGGSDGNKPMLVRKGELVVFSQYVNSRKKNIYGADAYEFRPERWESGELGNVRWAYFPFSGGPRQCLGEDFAQMEISYTIVRLLQTFSQILLPQEEPNEPIGSERQRLTLVLSSAEGCKVEIRQE
ncbi:hypothetical protein N7461_004635 [Penicillium sp. DV-2018c]|nr:hypothetical protein N7461_004635 [Penicillium sp. DV-2018c]